MSLKSHRSKELWEEGLGSSTDVCDQNVVSVETSNAFLIITCFVYSIKCQNGKITSLK